MIIGVDVDGVIADLHFRWIELYNQDFNDGVCVADLTHFDADKWPIKNEAKQAKADGKVPIYEYLRRSDLYDKVPVVAGAKRGISAIKAMGHRVVYVTSNARGMTEPKWTWLETHGFLPVGNVHSNLVIAHDKSLINVDMLIDDKLRNVRSFPRKAILFSAPWNSNPDENAGLVKAYSWFDVVNLVKNAA